MVIRCGLIRRESEMKSASGAASGSSLRSGEAKKEAEIAHSLSAHAQPTMVVFRTPGEEKCDQADGSVPRVFLASHPKGLNLYRQTNQEPRTSRPSRPVVFEPAGRLSGAGASHTHKAVRRMLVEYQEYKRKSFSTSPLLPLDTLVCGHFRGFAGVFFGDVVVDEGLERGGEFVVGTFEGDAFL